MNDAGNPKSILIADARQAVRTVLGVLAKGEGFKPTCVAAGDAAIEILATRSFDVVILEHALPDVSGEDILAYHRARYPDARNVILTLEAGERPDGLDRRGAFAVIRKPFDMKRLTRLMHGCAARRETASRPSRSISRGDLPGARMLA